jgi:hypothetical protein
VDRVNTTAKVFLGTTLNCCQCHDHKYDPFTQRDFYRLFAFFNSDNEVDLSAPLPGEFDAYQQKKTAFERKQAELQAAVAAYRQHDLAAAQQKWEADLKLPELRQLPGRIRAILFVDRGKRTPAQQNELTAFYAKTDAKLLALTGAATAHAKTPPQLSQVQTLALGPLRKTHVLIRGDFLRPGAEVEPGTPTSLPSLPATPKPTRLDLAKWLVDPANPLTARVVVNWTWHKYFGRGLVPTLEDFGTQGAKPSHPELLDWLATEFIRQKWSLKALHKAIVKSATYRQASATRPELLSRDPLNVLLARQSRLRLEAEVVRDVALAASGLLNAKVGGPSVRPPQPSGIAELTYAGSARWVESTGPDRYRRGLYTWFQRTSPYPMLRTFDSPDSNLCCVRRERSNTPLQALTLLNDTVFVEAAQGLGQRIVRERPHTAPANRIRHAVRLCLGRDPQPDEWATLGHLYEELLAEARAKPGAVAKLVGAMKCTDCDLTEQAAWVALARTLLNLDETITRD